MKFLALLLSIYILALNFAPCADDAMPNDEVSTEISQAIDHDHQHQGADGCSPFCICQCCHVNTTYLQISDFKFHTSYVSSHDLLYLNGIEKEFTTSILQPPRV